MSCWPNPAVAAGRSAPHASSGAQMSGRPKRAVRHRVRTQHRHSVGVPATKAGPRLRHDVPAAPAGLVRRLAFGSLRTSRCWPSCMPSHGPGLVKGGDRQLPGAGPEGRPKTGPSPVDRARPGSRHHVIIEAHSIPPAVSLTGGNSNDVTQLIPLIRAPPPVHGHRGRGGSGHLAACQPSPVAAPSTAAAWDTRRCADRHTIDLRRLGAANYP